MEDKGTSNSGNEPKKIVALKVPSLFIKSVPSGGGESGSAKDKSAPKKVNRPMPMSIRKKLEESKKNEEKASERTDDSKSESSNGSESSLPKKTSTPRSVPRAMPASRKILEQNKSSESTESANPVVNKEVKKPMPASIKRKLEEKANSDNKESSGSDISSVSKNSSTTEKTTSSIRQKLDGTKADEKLVVRDDDNDDKVSTTSGKGDRVSSIGSTTSSTTAKVSRPMPASRKLQMEKESLEKNEKLPQSDENVPKMTATPKLIINKPGPASVKRKAEESITMGGNETITSISKQKDGGKTETPKKPQPMPASARRKLEEQSKTNSDANETEKNVDSDVSTKPANKITISLDGIKFPKFSKPGPASAKRKAEEQKQTTTKDKDDLNTSEQFQTSINDDQNSDGADESKEGSRTRTRRSGSNLKMLTSLFTEKFPCQFCGQEFYRLGDKTRHEKSSHTDKKEKGPNDLKDSKKKSSKPPKSKVRKGIVYPDSKCPHCAIKINNRKKLKNHVYLCNKPFAFSCQHCDKKFQFENRLLVHMKIHSAKTSVESQDVPSSSNRSDYGSPVPSPTSICSNGGASKSSKESVVEKTKPIPKSVKAKLELKDNNQHASSTSDNDRRNSFKRKIADVLSNLGSRNLSTTSAAAARNNESDDEEEDIPPRKKPILSDGPESIQGHAMPASVRRKLEERKNKESTEPSKTHRRSETKEKVSNHLQSSVSDADDLDINECEVCHRMFSQSSNRMRHEKTVHSILEPRTKTDPTPKLNSTDKSPEQSPVPKPKSKPDPKPTKQPAVSTIDLLSLPSLKGKCPICKNVYTRLRKHFKTMHKAECNSAATVKSPVNPSSSSSPTPVRLSAPKSYKIYKTAANKAKQKLAASTTAVSSSKAIVPSEKLSPTDERSLQQISTTTKSNTVNKSKPRLEKSVSSHTSTHLEEAVEASENYNDHMQIRQPSRKRVINCKLCRHMFSHEDDFIMHMQFKHKDLVSGTPDTLKMNMKPLEDSPKTSQQKSTSNTIVTTPHSVRTTRTTASASSIKVEQHQQQPARSTRMKENEKKEVESYCKRVQVKISAKDRELAEKAKSTPTLESSKATEHLDRNERVKRRTSLRARTPSPEPEEVMDTYDEPDHYDDSIEDDTEDPINEIAITSTFSQRPPSPKKTHPHGQDAMPCSTCKEPFYTFEALKKHELYFHNVKTSKNMCPICGVYPTKLSRHLLAHENKTVRCSCAPCRLSFQNFGELLKHNLAKHPGPDGGAQCAPNKPRSVPNESSTTPAPVEPENKSDSISCKICSSSFSTMRQAKQHVWRVHPELTEDVEIYLKKSGDDIAAESSTYISRSELKQKNHDTIITIDSDNDNGAKSVAKPKPMPASMKAKLQQTKELERKSESKPRPSRPCPASVRAKLQESLEVDSRNSDKSGVEDIVKSKRPIPTASVKVEVIEENPKTSRPKPMPASVREKMNKEKRAQETKPMPEAVRANLTTQGSQSFTVTSRPQRAMPASARAKLQSSLETDRASQTGSDKNKDANQPKPSKPCPASVRAKLIGNDQIQKHQNAADDDDEIKVIESTHDEFDDDRDDVPSDVEQDVRLGDDDDDPEYIPEVEPEPLHSIPTFSIADEIAEHDRAVRIAMGEEQSSFHCKICKKKFDIIESTRRHIRMAHREFGPEHTESLIERSYAAPASLSLRTRKPNVRYIEDNYDDDDDEEEEIIRPPKNRKSSQGMNSSKLDVPDNCIYACKFCGLHAKTWTTAANARRHIGKSHKHLSAEERNDALVIVGADNISYNTESTWHAETPKDDETLFSVSGESPFQCQYCSARFPKSQRLDAHIQREHTGAEFLNTEEPEICMEDMVTVAQISVSASSRIQIDQPQAVSLDRRTSSESNGHSTEKRRTPGPKSKTSATNVADPMLTSTSAEDEEEQEVAVAGSSSPSKEKDEGEDSEISKEPAAAFADLSSLFPSLREAPSGLDAMDEIDGGMSLD